MDTNQHEFRLPKKRRGAEGTEFRKVEANLCVTLRSLRLCVELFSGVYTGPFELKV
jgi:hypothetical protein